MSTTAPVTVTVTHPAGRWAVDPVHSSIGFSVGHLVATFRAGFADVTGGYDADAGVLRGAVPVSSIDVRQDDLRAHLLSPEFFAADAHPEIRFVSTDVRRSADGGAEVAGDLTIRGVTRRVVATGTIGEPGPNLAGGETVAIELSTTVDRRDFGLDWNAELPGGRRAVGWDVTVSVSLELHREEA